MERMCAAVKKYFMGINLWDDRARVFARYNLLKFGRAWSPDQYARSDLCVASKHHSTKDIDLEELRHNAFLYDAAVSPGAGTAIVIASMLLAGMSVRIGDRPINEKEKLSAIEKSYFECFMEHVRRRIAPHEVSRINCLYVSDSRETIANIEGFYQYSPILTVRIEPGSKITRADSRWYDEFCKAFRQCNTPFSVDCAKNYWISHPYEESTTRWEYLVDGAIIVEDGLDDLRDALDEYEGQILD
jgi:hypothetical protein